jgi:hypothetical protein
MDSLQAFSKIFTQVEVTDTDKPTCLEHCGINYGKKLYSLRPRGIFQLDIILAGKLTRVELRSTIYTGRLQR